MYNGSSFCLELFRSFEARKSQLPLLNVGEFVDRYIYIYNFIHSYFHGISILYTRGSRRISRDDCHEGDMREKTRISTDRINSIVEVLSCKSSCLCLPPNNVALIVRARVRVTIEKYRFPLSLLLKFKLYSHKSRQPRQKRL